VHDTTGELDRDEERLADPVHDPSQRQALRVQLDVVMLLVAVRVDGLAEVAPSR